MNNIKKRGITILLSMLLMLALMPAAVFADTPAAEEVSETSDGGQSILLQEELTPIENVTINVLPPIAGQTSYVPNAHWRVAGPEGEGYSVGAALWELSKTEATTYSGNFSEGGTYYMGIYLQADENRFFRQSGGDSPGTAVTVNGASVESDFNIINSWDEETGSTSIGNVVVSFTPGTAPAETGMRDVWIDNTVDNSVSYVTGSVFLTGDIGTQMGYNPAKEVYSSQAAVTFSNPRTPQVQGMIDAAETQVYTLAKACKDKGTGGEFHMSTSESTGRVWDNRKYETVNTSTDMGGTSYNLTEDTKDTSGATWYVRDDGIHVSDKECLVLRTHIASGDYGKETFYKVEANGWVSGDSVPVTGVSLDKSSANLIAGKTLTLKATVLPENASDKTVTWKSSDAAIASVDASGKVTGKKAGTATITVTTKDGGKTASCRVRVLFTDVADSSKYFYTPVYWAVDHDPQVTSGTSDTTFGPSNACTRAQIVTFLWKAAGAPKPKTTKNPFTDVSPSNYYYDAVLWAVENGITTGTSATTFGPKNPCTRAQSVTFLYNAQNKPANYASISFTDVKSTSYYYNAVRWAVKNGITAGVNATQFGSGNTCTRAQIVTFLNKAWKQSL